MQAHVLGHINKTQQVLAVAISSFCLLLISGACSDPGYLDDPAIAYGYNPEYEDGYPEAKYDEWGQDDTASSDYSSWKEDLSVEAREWAIEQERDQTIANTTVGLREGPGYHYPVVEKVEKGTPLKVVSVSEGEDWYELDTGGWIPSAAVSFAFEIPGFSGEPYPEATTTPNVTYKPLPTPQPVPTSVPTPLPTIWTGYTCYRCIKGNVSYNTGERIYHFPGCEYYRDTRINPARGERYFSSEAEAIAAGWRKAKNCPSARASLPTIWTGYTCYRCIKGNVSYNTGERIYHFPGCEYYRDTRINPARGERYFSSEAEAIAAGWRKAKNCP